MQRRKIPFMLFKIDTFVALDIIRNKLGKIFIVKNNNNGLLVNKAGVDWFQECC